MSWKPVGGINRSSLHNIVSSNFNNSVFSRVSNYVGDSSGITILNSSIEMSNNSVFDASALYVNNLIDISVSQPIRTGNILYQNNNNLYWGNQILNAGGMANLYWEDVCGVTTTKVNDNVHIIGNLEVKDIVFDNSSIIAEISQNNVYIGSMFQASGQLYLDSCNNMIQIGNGTNNTSAIRIGNSGNKNVYLGNPDSSNIEIFSDAQIIEDCSNMILKANTISIGKGDSVTTTIGESHSTYFSSFVSDLCNNSITVGAAPSWVTDFNNSNPTSIFQLIPGNLTTLHEIKGNLLGQDNPTPPGQPYPNGQYFALVIGVAGTGYGYFYTVNRVFNSGNNPGSNTSLTAPFNNLFNNISAPRQIYAFLYNSVPTEAIGNIYFYANNGLTFPNTSIIPGPIVPQFSYNISEIVSDTIKIGAVSSTIDFSGSVAHFQMPNVNISGNLSKTSGSFKIDHPLDIMNSEYYLIHSFVESNQPDNIYTGEGILDDQGESEINIDTYFNMTNGTMNSLNRNIRIMVIGNGFNASWKLKDNLLKINGQESGEYTFQLVGERKDPHIQKFWNNDKYITEVKKYN